MAVFLAVKRKIYVSVIKYNFLTWLNAQLLTE